MIEMNNKYQYQTTLFQILILYFNINKYKTFLDEHPSEIALSYFPIKPVGLAKIPGGLFEEKKTYPLKSSKVIMWLEC